jgi:hypothetical protein
VKTRNLIRIVLALALLVCLLILFIAPDASAGKFLQANGLKQLIRVLTVIALAALALAINGSNFRLISLLLYPLRKVYLHGFGPDLLDKTCARLC